MGLYDDQIQRNQVLVTEEYLNNLSFDDYGLSPAEVKKLMFGLRVQDPETGKEMDDVFYTNAIESALSLVEQDLDIAIFPRPLVERHDYTEPEFQSYQYTHTRKRPIIQVDYVGISHNDQRLTHYPRDWWNVYNLPGHIEIMPSAFSQVMGQGRSGLPYPVFGGNMMNSHANRPIVGKGYAPQLMEVHYIAGMLPRGSAFYNKEIEMPASLEKLILKYTVREIFQLWGRLLVQPGLAGTSITIDGITESVNTTQSAMYSAVSADIQQVNDDIQELTASLRKYFGGSMTAV